MRTKLPLEMDFFRDLRILLSKHIQENDGFFFSKNNFNKIYENFENGIYSKNIQYRLTSILEGFTSDLEELIVSKNFKIRKINEEEKISAIDDFRSSPWVLLDMIKHEYLLEMIVSKKKGLEPTMGIVQEKFEDLVTSLRLLKNGCVTSSHIKSKAVTWSHFGGSVYSKDFHSYWVPPCGYELKKSESSSVLKLWKLIRIFRKNSFI